MPENPVLLRQEKQQSNYQDGDRLHDQMRIAEVSTEEFEHGNIQDIATNICNQVSDSRR